MPECKKCGAEIGFVRTKKNQKWIPIDLPSFVCVAGQDVGSVVTPDGDVVNTTFRPFESDTEVHNCHFGTCPQGEHVKSKTAR